MYRGIITGERSMKSIVGIAGLIAFVASGAAFADGGTSCATAQEVFSNSSYSGDTSTSTNFIGAFGGLPSPGPDLAFKFTAGSAAPLGPIAVQIVGGWNAGAVITASCGGNAGNPLSAATSTTSMSVPTDALTVGTLYYFYITGNPSDNSGPSGAFSFSGSYLPVTIQTFLVD
jgi:hypothetical protein